MSTTTQWQSALGLFCRRQTVHKSYTNYLLNFHHLLNLQSLQSRKKDGVGSFEGDDWQPWDDWQDKKRRFILSVSLSGSGVGQCSSWARFCDWIKSGATFECRMHPLRQSSYLSPMQRTTSIFFFQASVQFSKWNAKGTALEIGNKQSQYQIESSALQCWLNPLCCETILAYKKWQIRGMHSDLTLAWCLFSSVSCTFLPRLVIIK